MNSFPDTKAPASRGRRRAALIAILSLFLGCKPDAGALDVRLGETLETLDPNTLIANRLDPDTVGILVYDPDKRAVVLAHNRDKVFIPASVAKVPTTLAALDVLGAEHTFKTSLYYTGSVRNGTLTGDLYLKGTGDPGLNLRNLMQMAEQLRRAGVQKVEGRFYYDETHLVSLPMIDKTMPEDRAYNAGLSALSLERNAIHMVWRPEEDNDLPRAEKQKDDAKSTRTAGIRAKPKATRAADTKEKATRAADTKEKTTRAAGIRAKTKRARKWRGGNGRKKITREQMADLEVFLTPALPKNSIRLKSNKDDYQDDLVQFKDEGGHETWILDPGRHARGNRTLPVKAPGPFTARSFVKLCALQGIQLPEPQPAATPANAALLYETQGRPLVEIVEYILSYSDNMAAELLSLSVARKLTGRALGLKESGQTLSGHLQSKMRNMNWKNFLMANGSGLTGQSRISPEQMTAILLFADSRSLAPDKSYLSLLPIAGWRGTLTWRFKEPDAAWRVWAKSGTLNYAVSLAGYFFTASGKKMLFVFFISDEEKRNAYELMSKDAKPKQLERLNNSAGYWNYKGRRAMDRMIRDWIKRL